MSTPLVSIVIPCFNGSRFIAGALRSARAQTYPSVEVIVVDDGSTDDSRDVVRGFGEGVRLLEEPHRGGSAARNRGIAAAGGALLQFLDADDALDPRKLERQVPFQMEQPGDISFCDWEQRVEDGSQGVRRYTSEPGDDEVEFILTSSIQTASPLHPREWLEKVGGFREDLPRCQEFDLHLRLACAGARFRRLPEILNFVQKQPGSVSSDFAKILRTQGDVLGPAYEALRDSGGLSDRRARAFSERLLRSARHLWREGDPEGARALFGQAKAMHPSGGAGSYGYAYRFLYWAVGPMTAERLTGLARRRKGTPHG